MTVVAKNLVVPLGSESYKLTETLFRALVQQPDAIHILMASDARHKQVKAWRDSLFPEGLLPAARNRAIIARARSLGENQAQNIVLAYAGSDAVELKRWLSIRASSVAYWARDKGRLVLAHPAALDGDFDLPNAGKFLELVHVPFAGTEVAVKRLLQKL